MASAEQEDSQLDSRAGSGGKRDIVKWTERCGMSSAQGRVCDTGGGWRVPSGSGGRAHLRVGGSGVKLTAGSRKQLFVTGESL